MQQGHFLLQQGAVFSDMGTHSGMSNKFATGQTARIPLRGQGQTFASFARAGKVEPYTSIATLTSHRLFDLHRLDAQKLPHADA